MRAATIANKLRSQRRNIAGTENPQRTKPIVVKELNIRMLLFNGGTKLQYLISSVLFHVIKYTKTSKMTVRKQQNKLNSCFR